MDTSKRKPRVLVTYIESGMGHIMSATAISDGLKKRHEDQIELIEAQVMREKDKPEQIRFEKFLTNQTKATNKIPFYGPVVFLIMEMGRQTFMRFLHRTLFKQATDATIETLQSYQPDVIISTHYFITFCAIELKKRYRPDLLVVCYDPDNNVHVWWDNRTDLFITNNDRASSEAVNRRNFPEEAVKQVYFTARECVATATGTKADYRKKYGIDQDAFVVMVADGAYATGKAKVYCDEILKTKSKITVLFLAGKNEKLQKRFEAKAKKLPQNITLKVFGFMPEAYELYGAADIFVTKAGPNAVLDCLFMGTPVLIDYYPHPIEKATYELFVNEFGCGVAAFRKSKARQIIEQFAAQPTLLEPYRKKIAERMDKKRNGGEEAGDLIVRALQDCGKL